MHDLRAILHDLRTILHDLRAILYDLRTDQDMREDSAQMGTLGSGPGGQKLLSPKRPRGAVARSPIRTGYALPCPICDL